ncbi:MAG TPA: TetR/AcrR family transcriptional regulator [Bacillus sp. (in: firmicutes)]|uniref:TetR/AcrR family transcriptional regulator n=1 Tax=Bacillus litorisediminis TaxID=2922713 RepID=UPI001FAEDC73|nr:TetR/AcrR family transcriptional regulator [Bacillus litorisediminis]HWO78735.1 TetR/AcrR family transcriptional regulator [Bacillus sp. (in: firmicutes)]
MNDRKQHVINKAHQLFIEKGFQATSIQDILEYSGISKGTFYNYFSSKNELLIAIFHSVYKKMEKERNELLIGQDPGDIEIFIKQIVLQLRSNRTNKLVNLFEEVIFIPDEELKEFIKRGHLKMLQWLYQRFIDIFGESKKPYLFDCAIMFKGFLFENLKHHTFARRPHESITEVVRYSVARLVSMVNDVSKKGEQLFPPELLEQWFPESAAHKHVSHEEIVRTVSLLKEELVNHEDQAKFKALLDFIQSETLHAKEPRRFLVESAFLSLKAIHPPSLKWTQNLQKLEELV